MSDEKPILSYAEGATGPLSSDGDEFVFRPPPFAISLLFNTLVGCFFGGAAVSFVAKVGGNWTGAPIFLIVVCGACALFLFQHWYRAFRLLRFGGLPIKVAIANGLLVLIDPPQWGLHQESLLLYDVTGCDTGPGVWSLLGPTVCRLKIYRRDGAPLELRAATSESEAVDRAAAAIKSRLPSRATGG
jgi:hypothetical protein